LHAKAKGEPRFRFYSLYDKVYHKEVLWLAWIRCVTNRGAPGIDGQTFQDILDYGLEKWLEELAEELRTKTYRPQPVRRVYIPKPDGKQRPLGIPTIKDRVVQTALLIVLEPIFEADLQDEQYAYRAERSALDAVRAVHKLLNTGHTEVVDADLSGYFDTIPHAELMQCVARRVSDKAVLHLLKMWLIAPVEERKSRGHVVRAPRNENEGRGTPQGAPISSSIFTLGDSCREFEQPAVVGALERLVDEPAAPRRVRRRRNSVGGLPRAVRTLWRERPPWRSVHGE